MNLFFAQAEFPRATACRCGARGKAFEERNVWTMRSSPLAPALASSTIFVATISVLLAAAITVAIRIVIENQTFEALQGGERMA
jgi:hypothetical protein